MKHGQTIRKKPLFNAEQGEVFLSQFDDDLEKQIAKLIFIDGVTNEQTADITCYSKRSIERIRIDLLKEGLIKLIEKQIPKKPNIHGYREGREINTISYTCPVCNKHIGRDAYRKHCGQALDWSDTE